MRTLRAAARIATMIPFRRGPQRIRLRRNADGSRDRTPLNGVSLGLIVVLLIVLGIVDVATSQTQGEVARLLRVDWSPVTEACCPPRLEGYIYNGSTYRIGSVRLRVEILDGSNQVARESLAWVYVSVPARSRAYFSLRRPPNGEAFRLTVESFVLIAREGIDETP
jgi:hypothetical protein